MPNYVLAIVVCVMGLLITLSLYRIEKRLRKIAFELWKIEGKIHAKPIEIRRYSELPIINAEDYKDAE